MNPRKPITIRISPVALAYFRSLSKSTGLRYQTLIDHFLVYAAKRKLRPSWITADES